jgi:serine/threonine protein phosphatase PrpC
MKFSVFQISRKGGRDKNEDRMGYCYTKSSGLFLLADGMGGHPEGEVAAQMVLQVHLCPVPKRSQARDRRCQGVFQHGHHGCASANFALRGGKTPDGYSAHHLGRGHGAGWSRHWVHCGDSRLYFVRHGELVVRTRDHSYIEQHQDAHPDQALPGRFNRNVLYTCLGSPTKPVFDVTGPVPLQQGDKILLCSDGLWGSLDDVDIVQQLGQKQVGTFGGAGFGGARIDQGRC